MSKKVYVEAQGEVNIGDLVRNKVTGRVYKIKGYKDGCLGIRYIFYGKEDMSYTPEYYEKVKRVRAGDKLVITSKLSKLIHAFKLGETVTVANRDPVTDIPGELIIQLVDKDGMRQWVSADDVSFPDDNPTPKSVYKPTRDELKILVAEMIERQLEDEGGIHIYSYPEDGTTIVYDRSSKRRQISKCSDNDTFDTLVGLYVTLMKQQGEPLPPWVLS